jgi:uncharacterized protein YfaS (alpha-2-macroglobulin family)
LAIARAGKVLSAALSALDAERDAGVSRPDYGSRLRDAAAVLTLLAEANLTAGEMSSDPIVWAGKVFDEARAERTYTSTQENAWMTLAAEALAEHATLSQFTVDGQPVRGALARRWSGAALAGKSIAIANTGTSTAQFVATISGAPISPEFAASNGYAVERSFYKLDGTKIDLASIVQNERVVVALKVTESEARYARLLTVDRLPAGLEIDNPALVDSGSIEAFSWLSNDAPAHTEYRDDRFVAAFDRAQGQSAFINLAYVVRAVALGHYVYPPATAEDMYDPERYGRTGFSELEATAK